MGEGTGSSRCDHEATGMSIACPALDFCTVLAWPEFEMKYHEAGVIFIRSNELLQLQGCSLAPKRLLNEIEFSTCSSYVMCIYIYICVCVCVCVCIHISGYKCSTNHHATVVLLHSTLPKCTRGDRRSTHRPLEINPLQNGGSLVAQGI